MRLAVAGSVAVMLAVVGAPSAANAAAPRVTPQTAADCIAWGWIGSCTTAAVHANSNHQIGYSIEACGWGNIYDINTGQRVGPTNAVGVGRVSGLYGWYTLTVRNAGSSIFN